jgi:hypothetical protein
MCSSLRRSRKTRRLCLQSSSLEGLPSDRGYFDDHGDLRNFFVYRLSHAEIEAHGGRDQMELEHRLHQANVQKQIDAEVTVRVAPLAASERCAVASRCDSCLSR